MSKFLIKNMSCPNCEKKINQILKSNEIIATTNLNLRTVEVENEFENRVYSLLSKNGFQVVKISN